MFILGKVKHGKSSQKNVRELQEFQLPDLGLVWVNGSSVDNAQNCRRGTHLVELRSLRGSCHLSLVSLRENCH